MIKRLFLYASTIARLTPGQIWWRFRYTVRRRMVECFGRMVFARIEGNLPEDIIPEDGIIPPGLNDKYYPGDVDELLANRFTLLNHTIDFKDRVDWHLEELNHGTRLWKLTINYQEYLVDVANKWLKDDKWGRWFEDHVLEWMRQNPLGTKGYGQDNWNSYAISLRLVSWIRVYVLIGGKMSTDFKQKFLKWMAIQARFLARNVEWDILGNHIVKNWKALVWAGTFLNDDGLLKVADKVFEKCVRRQFTKSGMHEELSPMYAAIVLSDIRDVLAMREDGDLSALESKLAHAVGCFVCGDDWGRFNDSCRGMAKSPECFERTMGPFAFDGYVGGVYSDWQWAADCGDAVKGRQPGHAHCDALSFEYGRENRKVFANAGVYEYNPGDRRAYSRSSLAHNTLSVMGHDQHEMWKAFRCGRLGKAYGLKFAFEGEKCAWEGRFKSFDGAYEHYRRMEVSRDALVIEDALFSETKEDGIVVFHLTPEWNAEMTGDEVKLTQSSDASNEALLMCDGIVPRVEKMRFFPAYGKETMADVIVVNIRNNAKVTTRIVFK